MVVLWGSPEFHLEIANSKNKSLYLVTRERDKKKIHNNFTKDSGEGSLAFVFRRGGKVRIDSAVMG